MQAPTLRFYYLFIKYQTQTVYLELDLRKINRKIITNSVGKYNVSCVRLTNKYNQTEIEHIMQQEQPLVTPPISGLFQLFTAIESFSWSEFLAEEGLTAAPEDLFQNEVNINFAYSCFQLFVNSEISLLQPNHDQNLEIMHYQLITPKYLMAPQSLCNKHEKQEGKFHLIGYNWSNEKHVLFQFM